MLRLTRGRDGLSHDPVAARGAGAATEPRFLSPAGERLGRPAWATFDTAAARQHAATEGALARQGSPAASVPKIQHVLE